MKKILFGLLIVGALSACTSSDKKMDIPTQVQSLNNRVSTQTQQYKALKSDTENMKSQMRDLNNSINELNN